MNHALFEAFFMEGRHIADLAVLVEAAIPRSAAIMRLSAAVQGGNMVAIARECGSPLPHISRFKGGIS
jgi:hypothetical protein